MLSRFLIICIFLYLFLFVISYNTSRIDLGQLIRADEIAIVQFDSRPLKDYWLTSAIWNNNYCRSHGHLFLYFTANGKCHIGNEVLASPWCKVKTMLQANEDFPDIKFFIYLDSDAVIDKSFSHIPINDMISIMQKNLNWDYEKKPIIFNQDGPSWWCKKIEKVGYKQCLNAGTVAWYRHPKSDAILKRWWQSSLDPYSDNPLKRKFRTKWPWEQDRQMDIYHKMMDDIQIASEPDKGKLSRNSGVINKWCLSHLPGYMCFITHYCANSGEKQIMKKSYSYENPENAIYFSSRELPGQLEFKIHELDL